MNRYRIFETEQFLKDLEQEFKGRQNKIRSKLKNYVYPQLRQQPHFGKNIKKLTDYKYKVWRYRIGNWRFFYEIDEKEKIVSMTSADDRSKAY